MRVEQTPDVGAGSGPHRYSDTPVLGVSVGSLAVTVIDGCVPAATYSVVRFVPSIGYGTVVDAAPAPGAWDINATARATPASASDMWRGKILFIS